MNQNNRKISNHPEESMTPAIPRRAIVSASAVGLLGLMGGSTLANEETRRAIEKATEESLAKTRQGLVEAERRTLAQQEATMSPEQRAFSERLRNTPSMEERNRIMQDWQLEQMLIVFKKEFAVSEQEWAIIQPRIILAHCLSRTVVSSRTQEAGICEVVTQKTKELSELMANKEATTDQIRTTLTALRTAKEKLRQQLTKARQDLRQIVTVRQESRLVLHGVLD